MPVSFSVSSDDGVYYSRTSSACFGALQNEELHWENTPLYVEYFPFKDYDLGECVSMKAHRSWWQHLLSLPIIQSSLYVDPPEFRPRRLNEDYSAWSVRVRADIPADRMLQVLSFFRYPFVHSARVRAFRYMLEQDVPANLAFALSFFTRKDSDGFCLDRSQDYEHDFLYAGAESLRTLLGLIYVFQEADWEEWYWEDQDPFDEQLCYHRGNITDFASLGKGTFDRGEGHYPAMWHLLKAKGIDTPKDPYYWSRIRGTMWGIEDHLSSIVELLEDWKHEL